MFRNVLSIILLGLWITILVSACASSGKEKKKKKQHDKDSISLVYDVRDANKELDAFFQKLHERSGFNGNVLIAKKGRIIYENCFGWADYLHRDSLQIKSQFELASVSKPLTSTGVLLLMEQNKLTLNQTVNDFFPDFPYPGVTIKQLLTHRSGLPNYIYFVDGIWEDKRKPISNKKVIKLLEEHKPARYNTPGTRYLYNNTNFMLLAAIIEVVSGQTFPVYMQENVFKPNGMENTAVFSTTEYEDIPTDVVGHDRVWRRSVVQNFLDGPVGDKGIYSTVEDLFLFDQAMREGRVLKQSTLDSAYQGHSDPNRGVFNYGYGWRLFEKDGYLVTYHTGWWHGFKNLYVRDMEKDITIVLLSNLVNGSLNRLDKLYHILDMPVIRQGAYNNKGEYVYPD